MKLTLFSLLPLFLVAVLTACDEEPAVTPTPTFLPPLGEDFPITPRPLPPAELRGLEVEILYAEVIVRAKLVSVTYEIQASHDPDEVSAEDWYRPVLLYNMRVFEVLKHRDYHTGPYLIGTRWGSGWTDRATAERKAKEFLDARNSRYDDREAIVLLGPSGFGVGRIDHHMIGSLEHYDDYYSLSSPRRRVWFPATDTGDPIAYMLTEPPNPSPWIRDTITLEEMKSLIDDLTAEHDHYEDYRRGVVDKYKELGEERAMSHPTATP